MPVATVELILFAVQAGIKLIQTGRQVYVEATAGGEVDVPLPPAFPDSPRNVARNYARGLKEGSAADRRRFTELFEDPLTASFSTDAAAAADGEWRLVQLYLADMAAGRVAKFRRGAAELAAIAVLEQWERGQSPFPSAVQRVAGALVEIAIDYFLHVPGGLSQESRQGKALRAFLGGLDDLSFQDTRWDAIVVALFTTALDTLAAHPDIVSDEEDEHSLIRKIVGGVAADVGGRLAQPGFGDLDAEARLKRFGQIVLRSLLKNAGTSIVEDPSILGVEKGGKALVQSVGAGFLALLLGPPDAPLSEGLRRIASTDGLDKLIRAALRAVVEHPDLFGAGNQAVDVWLGHILADLYDRQGDDDTFFDPELFAEIAYAALDHGLRDLPLLLKPAGSAPAVLVEVARLVFDTVTAAPASGQPPRWKLRQLSRSDLKQLFEGVFASLASHTQWLSRRPQVQKTAAVTIPLVIEVLSDLGDGHLKPLLRSGRLPGVLVAVLASEVVKPASPPDAAKVVTGITAILNAVWASGVDGAARLLDENVLLDLLAALGRSGAAEDLFGGDRDEVAAVVKRLLPVLEDVRRGQVLVVHEIARRLEAA
jgi:hypothetical protein